MAVTPVPNINVAANVNTNAQPDVFAGWKEYPVNLAQYDPVTTRGPLLNKRINALSDLLFEEDIKVRLIDVREEGGERYGLSFRALNCPSLTCCCCRSVKMQTRNLR
jgi:hypothetical protein